MKCANCLLSRVAEKAAIIGKMEGSDYVEVGFAPAHENLGYAMNEVVETARESAKEENRMTDGELRRDRPYSASMISRKSTVSTKSKVSLSPTLFTSEYSVKKLCSYQEGSFARAVEICKKAALQESDGEYKGSWLLTEISQWNLELERVVLLTSESIFIIKFDFVSFTPKLIKKLIIKSILKLQVADLALPSTSFMPPIDHGGVRIHMGMLSFFQRWNPLIENLPVVTLTHHPAIYNKQETETIIYNADDFAESLVGEAERVLRKEGKELVVDESPILIESYAGILSVVHNQSKLGFNLDRGGFKY